MACTVVFDVNETLLSLDPVRAWFTSRFGDEPSATTWFGELLRLSFVSATTDRYLPFPELGAVALRTVADRSAQTLEDDDLSYISSVFTMLPAHPDVASGIDHLRAAGFTIAALTNSPLGTATEQLHNAGLADRFDSVMSVELVERFKPHVSVYRAAAAELGVPTSAVIMVAAHDWDIAGAMAAGCDGVFVARPGQPYSPAFPRPTLVASDIQDAAAKITAHYS